MDSVLDSLKTALEIVFCNGPGDMNEALQWINSFQISESAVEVSLTLLHQVFDAYSAAFPGDVVCFDILIYVCCAKYLNAHTTKEIESSFVVCTNCLEKAESSKSYIIDGLLDILSVIIILQKDDNLEHPEESYLSQLFEICKQKRIDVSLYIQLCSSIPLIVKRMSGYFVSISQSSFDTKWMSLREVCFSSVKTIYSSVSPSSLLSIPVLFKHLCQFLSNWYLLSHNEYLSIFDDDEFYEEIKDSVKNSISTKYIRISFKDLQHQPLFSLFISSYTCLCQQSSHYSPESSALFSTSFSCFYDILQYPSPSLPSLRSRQDHGSSYIPSLLHIAHLVLAFSSDLSSYVESSLLFQDELVPKYIDVLSRLITDHIQIILTEDMLLNQILQTYMYILQNCSSYHYCNLITESLNELFMNITALPESSYTIFPSLLSSLVYRAALPAEWYSTDFCANDDDDNSGLYMYRHSCQDVLLSVSSTSLGVYTTASILYSIGEEHTEDLAIQESMLYCMCGIVDSIEEQLLSIFNKDDLYESTASPSLLSLKRTDIPASPLLTEYDDILLYIFNHISDYTKHPLILSTAFQLMYSFDNWTFSRRECCEQLFELLIQAIQHTPKDLTQRLFVYISRLYESPCFDVTEELIRQVQSLSPFIHSLNDTEILCAYIRLLSTSVSYLPSQVILSYYQELLQPIMSPLIACSEISTVSLTESLSVTLKCLISVFCGCLQEMVANEIATAVLPVLFSLTNRVFQSPLCTFSVMCIGLICSSVTEAVKASGSCVARENCEQVVRLCTVLLKEEVYIENGLSILDCVMNEGMNQLHGERGLGLIQTIHSLFIAALKRERLEIERIKVIIRIEYVYLKEERETLQRMPDLVQEMCKCVLYTLQKGVIEEDLIRLALRSIVFIISTYSSFIVSFYCDIFSTCFLLSLCDVSSRIRTYINSQLVLLVLPSVELLKQAAQQAIRAVFSGERVYQLQTQSYKFKEKCVRALLSMVKPNQVRMVLGDIQSVISKQMNEEAFLTKYSNL